MSSTDQLAFATDSAWSVDSIRQAEAELMAQLPPGTLMARASVGLATVCLSLLRDNGIAAYGSRIGVLVGSGNNGADALYAAAHLARRGAGVDALLITPDRVDQAALQSLRRSGGRVYISSATFPVDDRDLLLDGVLGIGGRGAVAPEVALLAVRAAAAGALIVAVDLPSGVDADTGHTAGAAVVADVTVTFGALKPGLLLTPGRHHAGRIIPVDIGLTPTIATTTPIAHIATATDIESSFPTPSPNAHKYSRGVVTIAAGSAAFPGAGMLAVAGARVGGAGMVRYVTADRELARSVATTYPDVVVRDPARLHDDRSTAYVVGPGLGGDVTSTLLQALSLDTALVIDADALTALANSSTLRRELTSRQHRHHATVLTPHEGEFARLARAYRLSVDVTADRIAAVRALAQASGATVLLKGPTTVIAASHADQDPATPTPVTISHLSDPSLATAGSGDVLAGLLGAALAIAPDLDHDEVVRIAGAAAHLHGRAGVAAAGSGRPMTAADLPTLISTVLAALRRPDERTPQQE